MWSVCEANLAIIGSCIPIIKGFFTRRHRSQTKQSGGSESSSGATLSDHGYGDSSRATVRTSITGPPHQSLADKMYNFVMGRKLSSDEEALAAREDISGIRRVHDIHMVSDSASPSLS